MSRKATARAPTVNAAAQFKEDVEAMQEWLDENGDSLSTYGRIARYVLGEKLASSLPKRGELSGYELEQLSEILSNKPRATSNSGSHIESLIRSVYAHEPKPREVLPKIRDAYLLLLSDEEEEEEEERASSHTTSRDDWKRSIRAALAKMKDPIRRAAKLVHAYVDASDPPASELDVVYRAILERFLHRYNRSRGPEPTDISQEDAMQLDGWADRTSALPANFDQELLSAVQLLRSYKPRGDEKMLKLGLRKRRAPGHRHTRRTRGVQADDELAVPREVTPPPPPSPVPFQDEATPMEMDEDDPVPSVHAARALVEAHAHASQALADAARAPLGSLMDAISLSQAAASPVADDDDEDVEDDEDDDRDAQEFDPVPARDVAVPASAPVTAAARDDDDDVEDDDRDVQEFDPVPARDAVVPASAPVAAAARDDDDDSDVQEIIPDVITRRVRLGAREIVMPAGADQLIWACLASLFSQATDVWMFGAIVRRITYELEDEGVELVPLPLSIVNSGIRVPLDPSTVGDSVPFNHADVLDAVLTHVKFLNVFSWWGEDADAPARLPTVWLRAFVRAIRAAALRRMRTNRGQRYYEPDVSAYWTNRLILVGPTERLTANHVQIIADVLCVRIMVRKYYANTGEVRTEVRTPETQYTRRIVICYTERFPGVFEFRATRMRNHHTRDTRWDDAPDTN